MKVNSQVFRAYGIRGVVGTELSDELIEKLGKAIGTKLKRNNLNSLNICRDGRLSGPHKSKLFINKNNNFLRISSYFRMVTDTTENNQNNKYR